MGASIHDLRRRTWLAEIRRQKITRFNTVYAPTYDARWGGIGEKHQHYVLELLNHCPAESTVLDVACGTGKYWHFVLDSGRNIIGLDQSRGMLAVARQKYANVELICGTLQELCLHQQFPGAMCIDALENIPPEEWPATIAGLASLVLAGGHLYITIEESPPEELDEAYRAGLAKGEPIIYGEETRHFYHYYPPRGQVKSWLSSLGLILVKEDTDNSSEPGRYWHLICRRS